MMQRWRGLKTLVNDTVEHGSFALENLQKKAARRPFDMLERIPKIRVPVQGIREIHDTAITNTHGMIRLVNRVVGDTLDVVIDVVEQRRGPAGPNS